MCINLSDPGPANLFTQKEKDQEIPALQEDGGDSGDSNLLNSSNSDSSDFNNDNDNDNEVNNYLGNINE